MTPSSGSASPGCATAPRPSPTGSRRCAAVLGPIEPELWEAADAAFAAGTERARSTYTAEATVAVTSGLAKLGV